jgi:prepilin-type N-terminal cleavage/methylation domain-containing protein
MNNKTSKTKYSFTLVELMIVLAILALLAAIIIFAIKPSAVYSSKNSACLSGEDAHKM